MDKRAPHGKKVSRRSEERRRSGLAEKVRIAKSPNRFVKEKDEPIIELAKAISLTTENGVIVNELLRTKEADIWPRETCLYSTTPALGYECASSVKITSDTRRLAKSIRTLKNSPTGSSRVRGGLLWAV